MSLEIAKRLACILDRKIIKIAAGKSELPVAQALTFKAADTFRNTQDPASFDTFVAAVICENKYRARAGMERLPLPQ